MQHKLKKLTLSVIILIIISIFAFWKLNNNENNNAPDVLDRQVQQSLQNYLNQSEVKNHTSAVQLSIWLPTEQNPRSYTIGNQSWDDATIPATNNMMFEWGSITKEYTNIILFQLINNHQLALENTLGEIFPEAFKQNNANAWPDTWENITIAELMNMTSGIPDYLQLINFNYTPSQEFTTQSLIDAVSHYQKQLGCTSTINCFVPGSTWSYSNTNYILLSLIAQKITYTSAFNDIMNRFLTPIQQSNEVYYYTNPLPTDLFATMIHGYYITQNTYIDGTGINLSFMAAAGALVGNMTSLVKMTHALYLNQLIPGPFNIKQLQADAVQVPTGQAVTDPTTQCTLGNGQLLGSCYARGIMELYIPKEGIFWWSTSETSIGYRTLYLWDQGQNIAIAIAANSINSDISPLVYQALQIDMLIRRSLPAGYADTRNTTADSGEFVSGVY